MEGGRKGKRERERVREGGMEGGKDGRKEGGGVIMCVYKYNVMQMYTIPDYKYTQLVTTI